MICFMAAGLAFPLRMGQGDGSRKPVSGVRAVPNSWGWLRPDFFHQRSTGGHREQKILPVRFGQDARIEDHDNPVVGLGTDQSSDALLELEDGFGQLVLQKPIATLSGDLLEPSF